MEATKKYNELYNFKIEVINILTINSYNICNSQKEPNNNELARPEGFRLIQTSNNNEKEKYKTSTELSQVLSKKYKPEHYETILSLQYCILIMKEKETSEESIGHLRVEANECEYKEEYRRLQEQLINDMMSKSCEN